jgi:two-component system sensor histidine kinase MprB
VNLRLKVALAVVALAGVSTILVGVVSYRATSAQLHDEVGESLAAATSEATDRVRGERGRGDRDRPLGFPNGGAPAGVEDFVEVRLVTADGTAVELPGQQRFPEVSADSAVASDKDAGVSEVTEAQVDGERFLVQTTSLGDELGAIQAARSLDEVDRILASLRVRILTVVGLVVALAAIVGWLIATQITRRIVRLTATAEEVAATGQLDVDVPVGGSDEAGRLSTAFVGMLTALSTSRDDQKRLIEDASHELRTPITSLRTNLSVLERLDDLTPEQLQALLADVQGETAELTDLVNELVELATDRFADAPVEALDLTTMTAALAERMQRRVDRQIETSVTAGVVDGRSVQVERAITNLIDNAAKFDPDGTEPIEVRVSADRVEVADRGPGLSDDDLPYVFDRFYRSSDARSQPGSGLGLAIVADVAAAYDGAPYARNRDGGGAVIGFTWAPATAHGQ